jgi:hypothetical protein
MGLRRAADGTDDGATLPDAARGWRAHSQGIRNPAPDMHSPSVPSLQAVTAGCSPLSPLAAVGAHVGASPSSSTTGRRQQPSMWAGGLQSGGGGSEGGGRAGRGGAGGSEGGGGWRAGRRGRIARHAGRRVCVQLTLELARLLAISAPASFQMDAKLAFASLGAASGGRAGGLTLPARSRPSRGGVTGGHYGQLARNSLSAASVVGPALAHGGDGSRGGSCLQGPSFDLCPLRYSWQARSQQRTDLGWCGTTVYTGCLGKGG